MEIQAINNFKYGLDTRRGELVQQPGTLSVLENAHINAGGEIEKRQAFVHDSVPFPDNTFGLEATNGGLVTFGSDPVASALPLPTGVTYMRLQHPTVLDGDAYGSPIHDMSAVIYSTTFGGNPFVIAQFDGNDRYAYYAGELVGQYRNGVVRVPGVNTTHIAEALAREVNEMDGWSATPNVDSNGDESLGSVIITSPGGLFFEIEEEVFYGGEIFEAYVDRDGPGTPGQAAVASFTVTHGDATVYTVVAPANAEGGGTVTLATVGPTAGGSDEGTAIKIRNAINSQTTATGYRATRELNIVYVYAPIEWGDVSTDDDGDPQTFNLSVTATGGTGSVAINTTAGQFVAIIKPAYVNHIGETPYTISESRSPYVSVIATGGERPYESFNWREVTSIGAEIVSEADKSGIAFSLTGQMTQFYKVMPVGNTTTGYFKCKVKSATGALVDTPMLTVTLSLVKIAT